MSKKEQSGTLSILKMLGNIVSWTALVLLILVAGFLLYYIISSQIYATKGDKYAPKFSLFTIISPSMTPNINVYDIVIDKRVDDPKELKKGDVITFVSTSSISNGMTITHRIVDIIETEEGIQYKTKGDANITADFALVTFDKVIGKVKFRVPQLGRVQFFLSSKGGWILLILIPAIIIILADILKLFNLVDIKKRVLHIEKSTAEEEELTQEKLVEEYKKQQDLKKQLQSKTNKTKYKKNEYEEEGFLDSTEEVIVTVKGDKQIKNKTKVKEVSNVVIEDNASNEMWKDEDIIKDSKDEFIEDDIVKTNESIENSDTIDATSSEYNNVFKTVEDALEATEEDKNEQLEKLKAKLQENEDEDLELPKVVELREEIIPDDLDLPVSKDN